MRLHGVFLSDRRDIGLNLSSPQLINAVIMPLLDATDELENCRTAGSIDEYMIESMSYPKLNDSSSMRQLL